VFVRNLIIDSIMVWKKIIMNDFSSITNWLRWCLNNSALLLICKLSDDKTKNLSYFELQLTKIIFRPSLFQVPMHYCFYKVYFEVIKIFTYIRISSETKPQFNPNFKKCKSKCSINEKEVMVCINHKVPWGNCIEQVVCDTC